MDEYKSNIKQNISVVQDFSCSRQKQITHIHILGWNFLSDLHEQSSRLVKSVKLIYILNGEHLLTYIILLTYINRFIYIYLKYSIQECTSAVYKSNRNKTVLDKSFNSYPAITNNPGFIKTIGPFKAFSPLPHYTHWLYKASTPERAISGTDVYLHIIYSSL